MPTVLWLVEECLFYLGDLCWSFRGEISSYLQLPFERFWKMWLYRVWKNRCDSLAVGKLGGRVDKCSWYYSFRVFVDLNFSVIKTGGRLIIYTFIVKRKMKQTTQETVKSESESRSLLSQLCNPMHYTVHGILQARVLEWVAIPFSRGSSQLGDQTQVSCTAGGFFTSWATRAACNAPSRSTWGEPQLTVWWTSFQVLVLGVSVRLSIYPSA